MKKWAFLIPVLALAGCVDYSSPKSAVETASTALTKNDRAQFRESLIGAAADQYQSEASVDALINQLKAYKKLSVGDAVETKVIPKENETIRKYRVAVFGIDANDASKQIFDLQVTCVERIVFDPPGPGPGCLAADTSVRAFPDPYPPMPCPGGHHGGAHRENTCKIESF